MKKKNLYPFAFKLLGFIPNGALIFERSSDYISNLNYHLKAAVGIYHFFAKSKQSGIKIIFKKAKIRKIFFNFLLIFILLFNNLYYIFSQESTSSAVISPTETLSPSPKPTAEPSPGPF